MNKDSIKNSGGGGANCQVSHSVRNFGRDCSTLNQPKIKLTAFTLAEVLITIAIIGIVAALTIPSVIASYKDKQYNTARLKALKTFGEAGKLASVNGEINGQPNARAFVENVLSKYLKITRVCNTASECNFPITFKSSAGTNLTSNNLTSWNKIGSNSTQSSWTQISDANLSVYISTADGFVAKILYNPKCIRDIHDDPYSCNSKYSCGTFSADDACINVIYDMNGIKHPNHVGEDIGVVTTFWSGVGAVSVAPGLIPYDVQTQIIDEGDKNNSDASLLCASKEINKKQLSLPTVDEASSIRLNAYLTSVSISTMWTSSQVIGSNGWVWTISDSSYRRPYNGSSPFFRTWCVRR